MAIDIAERIPIITSTAKSSTSVNAFFFILSPYINYNTN